MKYPRLILALIMITVVGCSAVQIGIEKTSTPLASTVTPTPGQGSLATPTTSAAQPTIAAASSTPSAPTATSQPAATDTAIPATVTSKPPTATVKPTQPPAAAPSLTPVNPSSFPYLDDRSTPTGLIASLFNAINRKEYLRAYSYWATNAGNVPYDQFAQGYANTQVIQVKLGPAFHDEGAGQIYYSIGAVLKATQTDGTTQTYTACYNMHLGNPGMQGAPPFIPLWIEDGKASLAASGSSDATLAAHACDGIARAAQPYTTQPVTNTKDITTANYLDDRTGPVEVLSSMFNAINRHEYVRAYSYWESSNAVPSFDAFQSGYANTASVALETGTVTSDAGAGQLYYTVPVVIVAKTSSGATQTFSGCYTLHLAQPLIQGVPPFMPLAIKSAVAKSAANSADHAALLKAACPAQ